MPIDGREPHRISLDDARRLTKRARIGRVDAPARGVHAHAVSRGVIDEILAQPGCLGLRIYQAVNDRGVDTLVIVGITADEADMTDGVIAQETRPCPPFCADGQL
jgi:hypothetical protein